MMEALKRIKLNITAGAVMTVILGVVLLFWPAEVTVILSKAVAVIVIAVGIIQLIGALTADDRRVLGIIVSAIVLILGIWLFINPKVIATLVPIVFGILLVVHGVQDIMLAFEARGNKAARWGLMAAFGIISILFGAFAMMEAFKIVTFAMFVFGIMLIYDGLTDMIIVHRVNQAAKRVVEGRVVSEEEVSDDESFDA